MLDIRRIREDYEGVKQAVESRMQGSYGIERVPELDEKRRSVLAKVEAMKFQQGQDSKNIPLYKKEGKDVSALMAEMKELSSQIKVLDQELAALEEELKNVLLNVPNTPNPRVPRSEEHTSELQSH